jgi:hypothetical protein
MAVEENELLIHKVLEKYKNHIEIDRIEFPRNSIIRSAKTAYRNKSFPELGKAVRIFPFPEPNESFFLVRIRKKKSFAQRDDKRVSFSIKLDTWSCPNIQPVLHNLYKNWGVNPSVFRNKKFHLTQKKLWLINPAWDEIPAEGLVKIGLALAEKKSMGWKLTNAGTQLLNKRITKRIIYLEKDQLLKLFSNIPFSVKGLEQGYYILALDEQRIATVSHFKDILKTRLPHKFNLVFSF